MACNTETIRINMPYELVSRLQDFIDTGEKLTRTKIIIAALERYLEEEG